MKDGSSSFFDRWGKRSPSYCVNSERLTSDVNLFLQLQNKKQTSDVNWFLQLQNKGLKNSMNLICKYKIRRLKSSVHLVLQLQNTKLRTAVNLNLRFQNEFVSKNQHRRLCCDAKGILLLSAMLKGFGLIGKIMYNVY